ncbi:MAG TPA: UDP-N-acetylmuramate--L-alanine ligase [Ktedonobacterales bacterium]|nr:UDP-N-acetylmuramate--L-alanine ligase [Ktedonobacterales bacterium]
MAEAALAERFPDGVSGKRIHAVGAGGHGISAGVALAHARGALITCCDVSGGAMSRLLTNAGIPLTLGHDPSHVAEAELVVVSPAVTYLHPDLPELVAARAQGIPVVKWQALLGLLMSSNIGVSVAGVHGKGSTTALLGLLAIHAGMDPTVEVGDTVIEWDSNIHAGTGRYFINEADEWDYNFRYYHPRIVVLNAVEYDHPEFFPSYEAIRDAFVGFLRGMDTTSKPDNVPPPTIVVNADSPGCLDTLRQLGDWPGHVRTFSLEKADADARATEIRMDDESSFTLVMGGTEVGRVRLRVPGRHNIANALAAAAAADVIGVPRETMPGALATFRGLSRRFEIIEDGDVTFVDDYAHHPHAVAITIETARTRFPGRRIVAVFQPTLYTRLHRFLAPFAEALATADDAVVAEIQPSREVDTGLIHGTALVEAVARRPEFAAHGGRARYGGNLDETAALLKEMRRAGDVYVVMGSGPVNAVIGKARQG